MAAITFSRWHRGPGHDRPKARINANNFSIPGRITMNDATPMRPERNVELGASNEEFQNLHEFIRKARARLNQNAWDYIVAATAPATTRRRNRMSPAEIALRPRVPRDVAKLDPSVERLGRKMRLPVMMAPVGALEIF